MADSPTPPGVWTKRRRIIHATLIYCAVAVPAFTVWRPDSTLVAQVVLALIGLAASVIGAYVFGATWDDKNARRG
jgi:hypothetical protein